MKLRQRRLKYLVVLMLLSLCTFSQVLSQSINIEDYGAKYTVKPGDSMQYRYLTINIQGNNYINSSILLTNGTFQKVEILQGTLLTITVTNISTLPTTEVLANLTILTPDGETYHSNQIAKFSIMRSFDNQSILNSYVDAFNNLYKNDPNHHYSCDNNFFYMHDSYSNPTNSPNGQTFNLTASYDYSFNWHTGWLESEEMTSKYSNGTLVSSVKIERVTNNQLDHIINTGMNLTVIIIPIVVIAIVVFAFISYKKNNLSKANSPNKNSFSHYLTTNFKKQKQKSRSKKLQIDKSLEIIDDILKETDNR